MPLEYGLANYFPASYLDDPKLGAIVAQYLKSTTRFEKPFIYNLDNSDSITTLVINNFDPVYPLADAWGGLFWEIRRKLGQPVADKLLYNAWCSLPDEPDNLIAKSFIVGLLVQTRQQTGKHGVAAVQQILLRRGLKQSDFTAQAESHK